MNIYLKVPKSAYINVLDFKTPKALADYLNYLANNSTAFNSYFKWRKHTKITEKPINFSPICHMCIQLHLEVYFGIKSSIIQNLGDYWSIDKNCYDSSKFPILNEIE